LPENEDSPPGAMDVQGSPQPENYQPTLPSFPLPALPDAPPKSVLALQGLDQALVDAEIVNPAKLLAIPQGEGDGGTGLSERMRKRLSDLGIVELFAGVNLSHRAQYSL
jgi:ATP-dependent RNA helicase DDX51/DBP6